MHLKRALSVPLYTFDILLKYVSYSICVSFLYFHENCA